MKPSKQPSKTELFNMIVSLREQVLELKEECSWLSFCKKDIINLNKRTYELSVEINNLNVHISIINKFLEEFTSQTLHMNNFLNNLGD